MSERRIPRLVPDDVIAVQNAASDPTVSAFVAANAGSGKTHVLVQRVIRLLLGGTDPAKILCLTFTKAAAANMATRVFDTLAAWTACDDAALDEEIRKFAGAPPQPSPAGGAGPGRGYSPAVSPALRAKARRLFAQALETPGGLKVQTVHAFCTRLLHQFPFEAKVAARFSVLEERAEEELVSALRLGVLLQAAGDPTSALGRALSKAAAVAADQTFAEVLRAAIGERQAIARWIARAGSIEAASGELAQTLGLAPSDSEESVAAEILDPSVLAAADLDAVVAAIAGGSTNDHKLIARIKTAAQASGVERVEAYFGVFFTDTDLLPRKALLTKAVATNCPALADRLKREQERLMPLIERWRAALVRERSAALLTLADAVIRRYREEKNRRGLLDYDDLIAKTRELLDNVDAAWVHYKLDLGIDHVLIDEAQDTSAEQWDIVRRLVAEFTAGHGARGLKRSIFAVGDEKQSIYSFQGADPRKFADMRRHFARAHAEGELEFRSCRFNFSFRSGANVLGAVDAVFRARAIAASITDDEDGAPSHAALPDAAPGVVDIWPLVEPDPRPQMEGWDAPFDAEPETSPPVQLARRIATTIKAWLAQGECLAPGQLDHDAIGSNRSNGMNVIDCNNSERDDRENPVSTFSHPALVRPGDILILVRQRGPLFNAVIRALKDAEIAVAGADRLVLTQHIAVMDLLVLADALLSPHDDLALATALKSPLFGLSEEQLFTLAWSRGGTLRAALEAHAGDPAFAFAARRIAHLAEDVRRQTPFAFYAALLGRERGRARMLARLGFEAADALDEFLALALAFEARETPSVQGFVAWMRAASTEVKRDMEIGRDEVRVMTAHGAKGLEAPIVFVADTATQPTGGRQPQLLSVPAADAPPGTPDRILWPGRKDSDPAIVAQARAQALKAAEDEYRRLLYVALTRAEDRLIVCGARGRKALPKGCWYELVHDALAPDAVEEPAPYGEGTVQRWRKVRSEPIPQAMPARPETASRETLPEWLTREPPARAAAPPPLTPSSAAAHAPTPVLAQPRGAPKWTARARGRLVHRLLQSLPELAPERRAEAALRYLARAGAQFSEAERQAFAVEVLGLLNEPRFGPLFAPGSRAEVPIIGRLFRGGDEVRVSGQIDRLAVTPSHVLMADYKTDRPAPRRPEDVPAAYVLQLAIYRAVLAELYAGRELRAALAWTDSAQLMEIPSPALSEALHHHGVRAA